MQIKRVGPKSLGRVFALTYAILGFIGGLFFFVTTLFTQTQGGALAFGIGAVIAFPVLYGVMGFVGGAVFAWLYNVVAKRVGGIEIETE
jgi:hypothetical protein